MVREKIILSVLLFPFGLLTSCGQTEPATQAEETPTSAVKTAKKENAHEYGGWYCPDNLKGFPPVNVAELANVPVVNGRMPTEAETRNGTSLMYFDPAEYPTAKPLDLVLPKLAHYYANHTKQMELVVVIQAVVVGADTVVGFRYLNGGNGTSWFTEVTFLTDKEVADIGPTPFVFLEGEINAPKEKIWKAITKTAYAKQLGKRFNQEASFQEEWTQNSRINLSYELIGEKANGMIMTLFGNIYLQIDYDYRGRQFVEKVLIIDNPDGSGARIQIAIGPYPKDYAKQLLVWEDWLKEVKTKAEAE
jgi:hypothetical protein